jgi:hypothetical protein
MGAKVDSQVAAPAEMKDAQLAPSEKLAHKRVRMEGWRQRRMSSREDHSTNKGNCKTDLTLTGLLMEGLGQTADVLAIYFLEVYSFVQERGNDMEQDYDILERLPDTSVRCLIRVHGTLHVPKVLEELGKQTANECFAKNVRTNEILARVNDKVARRTKLIEHLGPVRPVR